MLQKRVNKFIRNPKKALFTLALPTIIGMTVQTLYNVVDTIFVSRLGVEAIAALTFAMPLFFIIIAVSQGLNVGMSAKISQFIGAKNKTAAENVALHGLFISIIIAVIIFGLGTIFLQPLLLLIGAEGYVLGLSMDYLRIILFAGILLFPNFILTGIFSAQGDTKTAMVIQVSSLIFNIILDPVFIYTLGFGVPGAAMATGLAVLFSLLLSVYFIRKKSMLYLKIKSFSFSTWIIKNIFFIGAPASVLMLLFSIYFSVINYFMAHFSNAHVAAVGIAFRIENVAVMPVVGGSIALLTLTGIFYGARRHDLLREIIFYALKVGVTFAALGSLIFFIFPRIFVRIFTADPQLIALASNYLRVNLFILPFLAIATLINRSMQGLGLGYPGLIINLIRVIVTAIPLAYIFVFVFNFSYLTVALADVIGGFIAAVVAVIWITLKLKKLHLLNSA